MADPGSGATDICPGSPTANDMTRRNNRSCEPNRVGCVAVRTGPWVQARTADVRSRRYEDRRSGRGQAGGAHRRKFVANTRWWPPFCLVVDWIAATIIAIEILAGVHFH